MRPWIPIVVFLIYSVFGTRYYVCTIKQMCGSKVEAVVDTPKEKAAPITFKWSEETPILNDADAKLQEVVNHLGEGQVVQITGRYFADEDNTSDYQNLGQARAEQVKSLLSERMEPQNIRVVSEEVTPEGDEQTKPFEAVSFEAVNLDVNKAEVLKMGDKVVILFPNGSSEKEHNETIDNYLDQLAKDLIANNKSVLIVGHTDMVGDAKANKKLGLKRAKAIRRQLRNRGVSREQIEYKSMGEEDPVVSNDSPYGRHQNRRVEIFIK